MVTKHTCYRDPGCKACCDESERKSDNIYELITAGNYLLMAVRGEIDGAEADEAAGQMEAAIKKAQGPPIGKEKP